MINNYSDFKAALYEAGFSAGGENDEGIFALSSLFSPSIKWHTDDADTDPWEFRMRVLEDKEDIAYAKLFFNKSGYITKQWYPFFLRIRRPDSFEEEYFSGKIPLMAKHIYEAVQAGGSVPLHTLKQQLGITKETKSAFESALTLLQMKMYLTMCGRQQKLSADGTPYGWFSTMFCLPEDYFGSSVFTKADALGYDEAFGKIKKRILALNPSAKDKRIDRFIKG